MWLRMGGWVVVGVVIVVVRGKWWVGMVGVRGWGELFGPTL